MNDFIINTLYNVLDFDKSGFLTKDQVFNAIKHVFEGQDSHYTQAVFNYIYFLCNEQGNFDMNYESFCHFMTSMTPFFALQSIVKVKPELQIVPLMQAIFNGIDVDHNKGLDKTEIKISVDRLQKSNIEVTDPKIDAKLKSVLSSISQYSDNMKDEELNEVEFMKICVSPLVFKSYNAMKFEAVFDRFDIDKSGQMEYNELELALSVLFPAGIEVENAAKIIMCCLNKQKVTKHLKPRDINSFSMSKDTFIMRFCPPIMDASSEKGKLDTQTFLSVVFKLLDDDDNNLIGENEVSVYLTAKGKDASKWLKKHKKTAQLNLTQFIQEFSKKE